MVMCQPVWPPQRVSRAPSPRAHPARAHPARESSSQLELIQLANNTGVLRDNLLFKMDPGLEGVMAVR